MSCNNSPRRRSARNGAGGREPCKGHQEWREEGQHGRSMDTETGSGGRGFEKYLIFLVAPPRFELGFLP